ncbi:MAG: YgeY family selenium metabolism-linked hydrolase [Armatimonadota bacterium]|nr:YgeY family selenium metabolism-linked hydrolase [Armatimonadota bacterium]MDR7559550.1 YgeY family selenium metabolism-linked hydrolase [Armatimonadota bacterium]
MSVSADVIRRLDEFLGSLESEMIAFLREIVAIPSMDGQLADVGRAVGDRMRRLGFEEVRFDAMGNILGRIGSGPRLLLYDSHLDTVGVSDRAAWAWDPFQGKVEDGVLYALGAGDEKGSTPPMLYALHALQRLGLLGGWTCYYFGNMEEWCDGIAAHALVEHERLRPEFVVIGEPTRLQVYRGHRGRVEVSVTFRGKTAHASAPERGDNAVYKAAAFVRHVAELNRTFTGDPFLGPGTIAVTQIQSRAPSLNAVPDVCALYIDRRITVGETKEEVLAELRGLPGGNEAEIVIPLYEQPSYTGFVFPVEKVYPAWALPEDHVLVRAGQEAARLAYGRPTDLGRWAFSTNGTYWMGKAGIPAIGFGPGDERYAHTTLDQVPLAEVTAASRFYALLPLVLGEMVS